MAGTAATEAIDAGASTYDDPLYDLDALGQPALGMSPTYSDAAGPSPIPAALGVSAAAPALAASPAAVDSPIGGASMWNGIVPFDTTSVFDPTASALFWDDMPDEPEDPSDQALDQWRQRMGIPDPILDSDDDDGN